MRTTKTIFESDLFHTFGIRIRTLRISIELRFQKIYNVKS